MKLSKLYNPLMIFLLRSPLHFFASHTYMLITFTGRKSGKAYTTPVEYWYDGDTLMLFTASERLWWRNLRGGAAVTVRIKNHDIQGTANATTGDPDIFAQAFRAYLRRYPGREKYFKIGVEVGGAFNAEDIAAAAARTVVVRIEGTV